jgi:hypothetical protein
MNEVPALLKETLDIVRDQPQFLTLSEVKKEVTALHKSLVAFLAKTTESKPFLSKEYLELHALLMAARATSPTLAREAEKSGTSFTGKEKNKKLALFAIQRGIASRVLGELRMDPDDVLRQQFRELAHRPEDEVEEAVETLLKVKQLEKFARAVGFEVVRKRTAKGETVKRKESLANARAELKPFVDSIRDAR